MARLRVPGRLAVALLFVAPLLGLAASAAVAEWSASAGGQQQVASTSLQAPASASASPVSASSTTVSWQASAGGAPPSAYRVVRAGGTVVCTQATSPCTDSGLSPSTAYTYSVQSRIGDNWGSAATASASTTTHTDGSFAVSAAAAAGSAAGAQQTVTITAKTVSGTDATTYTGTKTLTWSGAAAGSSPSGTAPTLPTTATFSNGVASVNVVLTKAGASMPLAVRDEAQGRAGSTTVTVSAANMALALSCPASAARNTDVAITLSRPVTDGYGNATPDATVTATAVNGTWVSTGTATATITLTAVQPSATGMLKVGGPPSGTTSVSTNAPTGYTAASCSMPRP